VVHWRMIFGKAGANGNKKRKGRPAPPFSVNEFTSTNDSMIRSSFEWL
jgi:hypothetical protein